MSQRINLALNQSKSKLIARCDADQGVLLLDYPSFVCVDPVTVTAWLPDWWFRCINSVFQCMVDSLQQLGERLKLLQAHDILCLLRYAFALPKVLYPLFCLQCVAALWWNVANASWGYMQCHTPWSKVGPSFSACELWRSLDQEFNSACTVCVFGFCCRLLFCLQSNSSRKMCLYGIQLGQWCLISLETPCTIQCGLPISVGCTQAKSMGWPSGEICLIHILGWISAHKHWFGGTSSEMILDLVISTYLCVMVRGQKLGGSKSTAGLHSQCSPGQGSGQSPASQNPFMPH